MIIVAKNACITAQTCINLCLTDKAVTMKQESKPVTLSRLRKSTFLSNALQYPKQHYFFKVPSCPAFVLQERVTQR